MDDRHQDFEDWIHGRGLIPAWLNTELELTVETALIQLGLDRADPAIGDALKAALRDLDQGDATAAVQSYRRLQELLMSRSTEAARRRRADHLRAVAPKGGKATAYPEEWYDELGRHARDA